MTMGQEQLLSMLFNNRNNQSKRIIFVNVLLNPQGIAFPLGFADPVYLRSISMEVQNTTQQTIEHVLYELTACVNELQGFSQQLSIHNLQQAELSLQKFHALISRARSELKDNTVK